MVMYEGRMMSTEEVLKIRENKKKIIKASSDIPNPIIDKPETDKPSDIPENTLPEVEIEKQVIESPQEDELEKIRAEYQEIF